MARRNRETLKKSFGRGQRPTEQDFTNLIDSTLNLLDDGLSKSPSTGIELAPLVGEKRVILSVFRESGDPHPEWELSVGTSGELKICRFGEESSRPVITLHSDQRLEIDTDGGEVEVKGELVCPGRKGSYLKGQVPADGQWHDISDELEGVCALEIIAAAGRRHSGKHAVLVALATHCFGDKPRIRKVRSHYGAFGHKLKLRWMRNGLRCKLQLKTLFNYGEEIGIAYQVSRLWDNPLMENL